MSPPTIRAIRHMKGVGILKDVQVGKFEFEFCQFNLIYGFNGSGKTTVSRLFDSFSEKGVNPRLEVSANFSIELSDGAKPDSKNPSSSSSRYISVFNEDYIEKSLFWSEGTAEAIVYIGEEQAGLAKSIENLEEREQKASADEVLKAAEFSGAEKTEAHLARDIARLIAAELGLGRGYNATNLRNDYSNDFSPDDKVTDAAQKSLKETINKTDLPVEAQFEVPSISLYSLAKATQSTLSTTLTSINIESLERRKDALGWVRQGLDVHSDESECLFCGNDLSRQRIESLRAALGEGFEQFKAALVTAKQNAEAVKKQCHQTQEAIAEVGEVLPAYAEAISTQSKAMMASLKAARELIDEWINLLDAKLEHPEGVPNLPLDAVSTWQSEFDQIGCKLFNTVNDNNNSIRNFSTEKEAARKRLKAHHLADNQSAFHSTTLATTSAKNHYESATNQLRDIQREIGQQRASLRDHKAAADEMNELLQGYLGHRHIQLVTTKDGYQIARNGSVDPKPLSEGERTAIAFCHFLATLKSEGRSPKDFVIVLDDPISSFDARAMTHAVALIQNHFGNPNQLFVLTHNLEFMREIKKWLGRKYDSGEAQMLFVECSVTDEGRSSQIIKMPKLIREYESEYHYLYSLVKLIAESGDSHSTFAYLMPNAIRKVLDIFLAFKIPGGMGLSPKVDKIIADFDDLDSNLTKSMERLAHLESHSESVGDVTTFSAYTFEQIVEASNALLTLIEVVDPDHKKAMDKLCK